MNLLLSSLLDRVFVRCQRGSSTITTTSATATTTSSSTARGSACAPKGALFETIQKGYAQSFTLFLTLLGLDQFSGKPKAWVLFVPFHSGSEYMDVSYLGGGLNIASFFFFFGGGGGDCFNGELAQIGSTLSHCSLEVTNSDYSRGFMIIRSRSLSMSSNLLWTSHVYKLASSTGKPDVFRFCGH